MHNRQVSNSKFQKTFKYKNENGEGIVELVCWGETLTDDIITVTPAAVKLPLKKG